MFDFIRWRGWIAERARDLRAEGFKAEVRLSDHSPKPRTVLDVTGHRIRASFANWNTGEADYDIADASGKVVFHKWGLLLDDLTFEATFQEFVANLRNRETL